MPRWVRNALAAGAGVMVLVLVYGLVTFGQVWKASRDDEARPADAIVVFGAAQYDGKPSPVLEARLDHAFELWQADIADVIVVTGGRQPGDRFTEATASANYLMAKGVPDHLLRREVQGTNTWESLAAAARILRDERRFDVILVSDPAHSFRIEAIADELGLVADVSPADTPYSTGTQVKHLLRETLAVSVGRIVGFRRLVKIDDVIERQREK